MSRIRTIKPEFWTSEQVVECSPVARLLFIGMWNFADDGGNLPASIKTIKMQVLPADNVDVQALIYELLRNGLLAEYEVNGKAYWNITGWKHQKISNPSFKFPSIDESTGPLDIHREDSRGLASNSEPSPILPPGREGKGREGNIDSSNDESCPKPKRHRTRKSYPEDFEAFWKAFPTDPLMSKAEAAKAWEKLSDDDRQSALRSVPAFRAYCGSHSDYRAVHACRYLSQRRFDGFAKTAEVISTAFVVVQQHSPEGQAWEQYNRQTKGKGVPWTNGIWRFPTQFPPEMRAAE